MQAPAVAQTGEWLSLNEAAAKLGLTIHIVRRMLQQGDLTSRKVETKRGFRWEVYVDGEHTEASPDASVNDELLSEKLPVMARESFGELVAFLQRLQRENMELAGRLGYLTAQLQQKDEQLQAAHEELRTLKAPAAETEPPMEGAATPSPAPAITASEHPRPWWWFFKLLLQS